MRRLFLRFGRWLVERCSPPPPQMPPIAEWEKPYLDEQKRELNRVLF